jgi:hypothetical protein
MAPVLAFIGCWALAIALIFNVPFLMPVGIICVIGVFLTDKKD